MNISATKLKSAMADSKPLEIRAKISRMGDKIHIIIPKSYHRDVERRKLLDQFVDVIIKPANSSGSSDTKT
jgi:hypothetical protein